MCSEYCNFLRIRAYYHHETKDDCGKGFSAWGFWVTLAVCYSLLCIQYHDLAIFCLKKLSGTMWLPQSFELSNLEKKSTILTTAGDGTWILSTDRGRTLFARWHNTTPSMSAQDKSCGSSTFNLCSMMDLSCWMQSDSSLARVACCLPLLLANFVLEVATMIGSSDLFVDGAVMISKSIKLILHSTHKKLMKIHLQDLVFSNIELDPSVVQTGGLVGLRSLSDEELVRCYK